MWPCRNTLRLLKSLRINQLIQVLVTLFMITNLNIKKIIRTLSLSVMLLPGLRLYANESWECKSSFHNITIIATAGYEDTLGTQKTFDAFLKSISSKLNLTKLPFKILILIDPMSLDPSIVPQLNHFSSVAYDTIRPVDIDFLFSKTNGRVQFADTIDYGITDKKGVNELGLKIILKYTGRDTLNQFDKIYTLVKYGVENIETIKRTQKNLYLSRGMIKVAVKTIDTGLIKKIPIVKLDNNPTFVPVKRKTPFIAIVIVVCIVAALYARSKK